MGDYIVPNTKPAPHHYAIRCPGFTASNNLGVPGPVGKYGIQITRCSEPQDENNVQVGERTPVPDVIIADVVAIAGEMHTLSDGVTRLSVAQILDAVNTFVNAHKGDNLPPIG